MSEIPAELDRDGETSKVDIFDFMGRRKTVLGYFMRWGTGNDGSLLFVASILVVKIGRVAQLQVIDDIEFRKEKMEKKWKKNGRKWKEMEKMEK